MNEMINFTGSVLGYLTDFLITPPIIYIVSLACFCFICKAFKILIS